MRTYVHRKTYTWMFVVASLTTAPDGEKSRRRPTRKQLKCGTPTPGNTAQPHKGTNGWYMQQMSYVSREFHGLKKKPTQKLSQNVWFCFYNIVEMTNYANGGHLWLQGLRGGRGALSGQHEGSSLGWTVAMSIVWLWYRTPALQDVTTGGVLGKGYKRTLIFLTTLYQSLFQH